MDLNGGIRYSIDIDHSPSVNKNELYSHQGHKQAYRNREEKREEKQIQQSVLDNRYVTERKRDITKTNSIASKPMTTKFVRYILNILTRKKKKGTNQIRISRPLGKPNPLQELQSKGKQYQSAGANEDDPPYNFQVSVFRRIHNIL